MVKILDRDPHAAGIAKVEAGCKSLQKSGRTDSNRQHSAWKADATCSQPLEKQEHDDRCSERLADCLADCAPIDPELQAVIDTWPSLPPAVRAGIVAMVKAAVP